MAQPGAAWLPLNRTVCKIAGNLTKIQVKMLKLPKTQNPRCQGKKSLEKGAPLR
jgi:hypothetical protein